MVTHGGLPTHMVLNPEPHMRPMAKHTCHSCESARSKRHDAAIFVGRLPNRSSSSVVPTLSPPTSTPAVANPEARPKKRQRVHAPTQITTVLSLLLRTLYHLGTWGPSVVALALQKTMILPQTMVFLFTDLHPRHLLRLLFLLTLLALIVNLIMNRHGVHPVINMGNRPWPEADDNEFIGYKLDARSRPSWKTIGQRMRSSADSLKARWQWLKNTRPDLLTRADNEAED